MPPSLHHALGHDQKSTRSSVTWRVPWEVAQPKLPSLESLLTASTTDLEQATSMAYLAISKAGLGGSLISLPDNLAISLPDVRKRVEDLLTRAMDRASKVIAENRPALDALAAALAENRYLDTLEIQAVIGSLKTPAVRKVGAPEEMLDDVRQLS